MANGGIDPAAPGERFFRTEGPGFKGKSVVIVCVKLEPHTISTVEYLNKFFYSYKGGNLSTLSTCAEQANCPWV